MHSLLICTFGARGDSQILDKYFSKFYSQVFFPYLEKHNIKEVFDLGDTFDRRRYVNFNTLSSCKEYFFEPLKNLNIKTHTLIGNHDVYFRNTNEVNSPNLLLGEYSNIKTYHEPQTIELGDNKLEVVLVPWVCSENFKQTIDLLEKTKAQVLLGHLELAGFVMQKGSVSEKGTLDTDLLQKFALVCSGHFHHKSNNGHIHYLGAPYEMTWADWNDQKGFHVFDTETLELEFIPNTFTIFEKLYYDDSNKELEELLEFGDYKDKYVKLVIHEKTNAYWFDLFYDKLEKQQPLNIQTLESTVGMGIDSDDNFDDCEDTLSILKKYCAQIESSADTKKLTQFMVKLYEEANEETE